MKITSLKCSNEGQNSHFCPFTVLVMQHVLLFSTHTTTSSWLRLSREGTSHLRNSSEVAQPSAQVTEMLVCNWYGNHSK